ncbi:polyprenyl synthetase family protein [Asanoa sp. NPDC049518]|uniref:polyprenyl synthetase family protein n=1 Tax=unclassified Asanoa TaxID=2685164 RepID=UPI0034222E80
MTVTLGNRSAIPAPRRGSGVFERARTVTEPALRAAVDSLPPTTRRTVGHHFGWWDSTRTDTTGTDTTGREDRTRTPAKAIRPALVLVAAEAVGGTPVGMAAVAAVPAAIPAAVAVELVHNFAQLRAENTIVSKVFGTTAARLAGDALLALAFDVLATTSHPGTATAAHTLSATIAQLIEGEAITGLDEDFRTARRRTGALLECSAGLGGLFGGGTPAQIAALRGFGAELGLAMQLTDDRRGIWGAGHPDLRNRKRTLPVVAALASRSATAGRIAEAYEEALSDVDAKELADALEADGWRDWCVAEAERHLRAALDQLEPGITTERRQDLRAIVRLVGDRDR